jgi:hypothetical protein
VIEAVAGTLAPLAGGEKPQLFPWLAVSLIKKRRCISELRLHRAGCGTARSERGVTPELRLGPFLLAFCTIAARHKPMRL